MSDTLRVELGERSYDIVITAEGLVAIGDAMKGLGLGNHLALISNPTVDALYGERTRESLKEAGYSVFDISVPDGEAYKTLEWAGNMLGEMLKEKLDRKSAVVALGGGVIGDMAGFAASIYMRGIRFVQVPTTLLAQVDSSVGGKTGVNHPLGKNLIGAFWQPSLVWIDVGTLGTLPKREFLAGMAEVIKYGVIWDEEFFGYLINNKDAILKQDAGALKHIIRRSCQIKAEVVSKDERESGMRAILNFGHTMGHAIETASGYTRYLHGEAVAIGMCLEAGLSAALGVCNADEAKRLNEIVELYGLPTGVASDIKAGDMLGAMELDKKTLEGQIKFILPEGVGKVRVNETVGREAIESFLKKA